MGNREWLPGKENRHKGKDTLKPYGYKAIPVLLFHTGIQPMGPYQPYKGNIWFITYHTHGLFNSHGK